MTPSDLHGHTIVITGASSGVGRAAAVALAERGAHIAVVGRNSERTHAVAARVGGAPFIADFDSLDEVRALATSLLARYPRIDALANNAGGLVSTRGTSADGLDRALQHNHLAPFLLTNLLLSRLVETRARVISTASVANRFAHLDLDDLQFERRPWLGGWQEYATVKLETILFIRELARRTAQTDLTAYSFHPGYVTTSFGNDSAFKRFGEFVSRGSLGISPEQGAAPLVLLASVDEVGAPSGTYFDGLNPHGRTHRLAGDDVAAARLWEESAVLVGL
ncbi:SDR family NAD(P)-dependent oxidoreductase [Lacisediminihabitans sp.]|jgi:NAD(P)-dependent dehydrogenase (short-subunit alcohol dehydrogenase family)|uniref:SDR family NAD(P)-dependent oxidoreductase n=1 Tax=Lacisediminihabitans sp. TaxID=2787631 RepID=UPI002F94DD94